MPKPLSTILNVLWLVFGGIELALAYVLAGIIACLLIITIPAGIASFRMARYVVWPFGRTVTRKPGAGTGSTLMNVIWFIVVGWLLAVMHVVVAIVQSITIIGVANAVVSIKMIPVSVFPFGKQIVASGHSQNQRQGFTR
ncbi:YccF domain-containing protein [Propionibacterium sp.]|uniref:YccF domain-containing protein n=1 Tax=Propionibacterium sp. TaxID=1977903 RepID=UPI0039E78D9F